jgi:hypothetical protein
MTKALKLAPQKFPSINIKNTPQSTQRARGPIKNFFFFHVFTSSYFSLGNSAK